MADDPSCDCFDQYQVQERFELKFHAEKQDTRSDGWKHILDLIEEAAMDGREEFAPGHEMTQEEWSQIVTLPPTISKLKAVKHLLLYRSHLVRIPPEIGEMTSLEEFTPYTSYRLHWFPYEITRCKNLRRSTVSTRALYGNYKLRPAFPNLQSDRHSTKGLDLEDLSPAIWGAESITTCSVCNRSLAGAGLYQVWISLSVATDVLPLLVNACSMQCVYKLPKSADEYVQGSHKGGPNVNQPPSLIEEIYTRLKKA